MGTIKTAISLDESVFQQAEDLAREMNVSRSRLVSLALAEFIRKRRHQHLLEQINAAVEETTEPEERAVLHGMRKRHRNLLDSGWSETDDDQPG